MDGQRLLCKRPCLDEYAQPVCDTWILGCRIQAPIKVYGPFKVMEVIGPIAY